MNWWQILADANAVTTGGSARTDGFPKELILVFMVGIGGLLLWYATKRRLKQMQKATLTPREQVARGMQGREVYQQIGELMGELSDLSRQINGQLDTRLAKLEVILREADRAIARLEGRLGKTGEQGKVVDGHPIDNGQNEINGELASRREVLERSAKGMTAVGIAQELGRPVGEIELILALARRKGGGEEK